MNAGQHDNLFALIKQILWESNLLEDVEEQCINELTAEIMEKIRNAQ